MMMMWSACKTNWWDEMKHWIKTNSFSWRLKRCYQLYSKFLHSLRQKLTERAHPPPEQTNLQTQPPPPGSCFLLIYPGTGTPASIGSCLCLHWGHGIKRICVCVCMEKKWEFGNKWQGCWCWFSSTWRGNQTKEEAVHGSNIGMKQEANLLAPQIKWI